MKYLYLTIIALALLVGHIVSADIYDSSLIGWWTLDRDRVGPDIIDSAPSPRDGWLLLGASGSISTTSVAAPTYQGLSFDGTNDRIGVGSTTKLNLSRWTISVWFLRKGNGVTVSSGTGGVTCEPLVMKLVGEADGDTRDGNYGFCVRQSGAHVLQGDFERTPGGLNSPVTASTTLVDNRWYHGVFTFDGVAEKIYLNGKLDGTYSTTSAPQSSSVQGLAFSAAMNSSGTLTGAFNGNLDNIRIYNRALSASEIAQLYNTGLFNRFK